MYINKTTTPAVIETIPLLYHIHNIIYYRLRTSTATADVLTIYTYRVYLYIGTRYYGTERTHD